MALQLCHNRWRGGADTEAPGFIACRRHDPAFASTHNGRRNALQARVVALLYGSIDGIMSMWMIFRAESPTGSNLPDEQTC
jgi:hypothetical protein